MLTDIIDIETAKILHAAKTAKNAKTVTQRVEKTAMVVHLGRQLSVALRCPFVGIQVKTGYRGLISWSIGNISVFKNLVGV